MCVIYFIMYNLFMNIYITTAYCYIDYLGAEIRDWTDESLGKLSAVQA